LERLRLSAFCISCSRPSRRSVADFASSKRCDARAATRNERSKHRIHIASLARTLEACEEVVRLLGQRHVDAVVIGAMALAVHGYRRAWLPHMRPIDRTGIVRPRSAPAAGRFDEQEARARLSPDVGRLNQMKRLGLFASG